jgi:putative ABC transport system permease protein
MSWLQRLTNTFRRSRLDDAIDEEMRFHVRMRAADLERGGMSPEAAEREAQRLFGNPASLRDRTRESDVSVRLETALQDVRYAVRVLWREPVFTAAAAATLALGIGVNTAMFGVLYGVLIRPLPYAEADRLFLIFQSRSGVGRTRVAPLDYLDIQQRTRAFMTAGIVGTGFTLTGSGDPELAIGQLVTGHFFGMLGVRPALGRTFGEAEESVGEHQLMVLSHGLWQRRFGGDPAVIGRTITANGRPFTIVGVMPPGFTFQGPRYQLWVPLPLRGANPDSLPITRTSRFVQIVAKLKAGISTEAGAVDLRAVASSLVAEYPDVHATTSFVMSSLIEETVGNVRQALQLLFTAVVLVLLIACGNVTSLLLARFTVREPEVLVRSALGATRGRLVRQFVIETLVLYAIGTMAGIVLAAWLLSLVRTLGATAIPRAADAGLMGPVLLFTCATSLFAALAFGLAPAWQAARTDSVSALRSRTSTAGVSHQRFRSAIVVAQVAVALCLLAGASLVARSLLNLQRVEKGFDPEGRLTFSLVMPPARFPSPASMHAFHGRVLDALSAQREFTTVGATTHLPLSGQDLENGFTVDGYVPTSPDQQPIAGLRGVSAGYAAAMGIAIRAGRPLEDTDDARGAPVVLVNEAFARRYFGGREALGGRIAVGEAGGPWRTIVGIVANVKHRGLATDVRPEVLIPYTQLDEGFLTAWARGFNVVVRTDAEMATAARMIRQHVREADPNMPIIQLRPMGELVSDATAEPRFRTFLLVSFAVASLCLAAVGIFGVLSYVVSERRREIGIRMALGALPRAIFRDVLAQGARLVLLGAVIGIAGGALLSRWIQGLLFRVSPADPLTFTAAVGILAVIGLIATLVPARRATRVDPVAALRA